MCAGMNRQEVGDERASRERTSDPLGPESCAVTARDAAKQSLFVDYAHGNGKAQAAGEAGRHLDCTQGTGNGSGDPFYQRLNEVLEREGFDEFVESRCTKFYAAKCGRPSLTPGIYIRSLLIGYFEGIDSERGIAWRMADSLVLRRFVGIGLDEQTPDHSTISRTLRCGEA